jgi:hypothetical protein
LFEPELVVRWTRGNRFGEFAGRYFRGGREFAALRSKRISALERFARAVTAPALPFVLLYQRVRAVAAKRRYLTRLIATLPLLAAFMVAWSAGEFLGYLAGPGRIRT